MAGVSIALSLGATVERTCGAIDLTLKPVNSVVNLSDTVEIQVYVSSDSSVGQFMSAMQMIFSWENSKLQLVGRHQIGAVPLLASFFPADPYGINEANPPQDGLGLYQAIAPLGNPISALPAGTLLTTLIFNPLVVTPGTPIGIVPAAGNPVGQTVIYDGFVPGLDVKGILTPTSITIIPAPSAVGLLALTVLCRGRRRRNGGIE